MRFTQSIDRMKSTAETIDIEIMQKKAPAVKIVNAIRV